MPAHPGERAWLGAHRPAYRRWLADDPVTALLADAALGRTWIADIITVPPCGDGEPEFAAELARLRQRSADGARGHLAMSLGGPPPAAQLVALTGQGLGSVGRHLKMLHDAGLVRRRRSGRSVFYCRTAAAENLLQARSSH